MSRTNRKIAQLEHQLGTMSTLLTAMVLREGRVVLTDAELKLANREYYGVRTEPTERGIKVEPVRHEESNPEVDVGATPKPADVIPIIGGK